MALIPTSPTIVPKIYLTLSSNREDISERINYFKVNKTLSNWWIYGELQFRYMFTDKSHDILNKILDSNFSDILVEVELRIISPSGQTLDVDKYKFKIFDMEISDPFSNISNTITLSLIPKDFELFRQLYNKYYEDNIDVYTMISDLISASGANKSSIFDNSTDTTKYKYIFIPQNTIIKNIAYVLTEFKYSNLFTIFYLDNDGCKLINVDEELKRVGDTSLEILSGDISSWINFGGYLLKIYYENNASLNMIMPNVVTVVRNIHENSQINDFYQEETFDLNNILSKASKLFKSVNTKIKDNYYKLDKNSLSVEDVSSLFIDGDRLFLQLVPYKLSKFYVGKIVSIVTDKNTSSYFRGYWIITDIDIIVETTQSSEPVTNLFLTLSRFSM